MEEQMDLIDRQKSQPKNIEHLTRLKLLTPKTMLFKCTKAIKLRRQNLFSCMQFIVQFNYLLLACHRQKYHLKLSKSIYLEQSSGNVYAFYEISGPGQKCVMNKYQEHFQIFGKQEMNIQLLNVNKLYYTQLYEIVTPVDNEVIVQYNTIASFLEDRQQEIYNGSIKTDQIIQELEKNAIFYTFSLNLKLRHTLFGFSINIIADPEPLLEVLQEVRLSQKEIRMLDKIDILLDYKKQLSIIFTLFVNSSLVSLEHTSEQSERKKPKMQRQGQIRNRNESSCRRRKFSDENLINFSVRINEQLFRAKERQKLNSARMEAENELQPQKISFQFCDPKQIFNLNIYSNEKLFFDVLYSVKLYFQTYMYEEEPNVWILSICLKIPITLSNLQMVYFKSIWNKLNQHPRFNVNGRNFLIQQDKTHSQFYFVQCCMIERGIDIVSEIIYRCDELIILYLCVEPFLQYFGRRTITDGRGDPQEIQRERRALLSDRDIESTVEKMKKATDFYNRMMKDIEFNKFHILSSSHLPKTFQQRH